MSFINNTLSKLFGKKSDRDLREIMPRVVKINQEWENIKNLSNDGLRDLSADLKKQIQDHIASDNNRIDELKSTVESIDITQRESVYDEIDTLEKNIKTKIEEKLNDILPTAFALVKETARRFTENKEIKVKATDLDRFLALKLDALDVDGEIATYYNTWTAGGSKITWNMVHYDVQLIGGIVLHEGKIAEMATGEGKTLVATLPVFLNALSGRGVHLVTVNDYLAKRDAEWMGPIFQFHGLTVDCIDKHEPNSESRRKAYNADITYGTNNEFGFDYLRDNMVIRPEDMVQRPHNYSIVDEVDSVLIDDARTPLIISGAVSRASNQLFDEYKSQISRLEQAQRKLVSQILIEAKSKIKAGDLENGGILLLRAFKGLPKLKPLIKFLSEQGMKTLMHKTENVYLAENAKRMPEITDELYFVIEEKNNSIELTDKGHDFLASDSGDSSFFVLPDIGSEIATIEKSNMTENEKQDKIDELSADYGVKSERIHSVNQLLKAYTLFEKDVEYVVIDKKVKIVDEQTGRIMEGRRYSDGLHQAIEAKEGVKVEAATQTLATITLQNYFRMYNKLAGMTGTAETEAGELWDIYKLDVVVIPTNKPIARDDREDLVYKTKREKYNAVIEEITELVKAGRPVLVGTTSVEISEFLSRTLKIRKIEHNVLNAKLHQREADIVATAGQASTVTIATNMAGRGTDIKLSPEVISAGGLAIIGTERHESRRVDRQLRGRAGRQGDPGSSQFFVSLEDDLMRMFGSDRISKLMDRMGLEEGEVIQHSMISKSIERAQKKVEENNFGIRKRLLEYDDVMNSQRDVIYTKRRNALYGERLGMEVANMIYDSAEKIVNQHHQNSDYQGLKMDILRVFAFNVPFTEAEFLKNKPAKLASQIEEHGIALYKTKSETIKAQAMPVIKRVFEEQGKVYENIVIPITDGNQAIDVVVNLKETLDKEGADIQTEILKNVMLGTIDDSWKDHLRELDDLKQSVQNASYEQKDPLLIYKFESFNLFSAMIEENNEKIVTLLTRAHIPIKDASEVKQAHAPQKMDMSKYETSKSEYSSNSSNSSGGQKQQEQQKIQPIRTEKKIGRNDLVEVRYGDGKVVKTKYKKVEDDVINGRCVIL